MGHVVQAVKDAGLEDNTLVIFTSDNGGERFSDNWPLVGGKMDLTEGGIRVPSYTASKSGLAGLTLACALATATPVRAATAWASMQWKALGSTSQATRPSAASASRYTSRGHASAPKRTVTGAGRAAAPPGRGPRRAGGPGQWARWRGGGDRAGGGAAGGVP